MEDPFNLKLTTYILSIILSVFTSHLYGQKEVESYHSNDTNLIYQKYSIDSKTRINGAFKEYFINQNIAKRGLYKQNLPDSTWSFFYENGSLKSQGNFNLGVNTGIWRYFYENGAVRMVGELAENKKNGLWEYYYENKTIKKQGYFKTGRKNGLWKYYTEEGVFKAEADFVQDEGIYIGYYEDGVVKMKGIIKSNVSTGVWKYYYPNGVLKAIGKEEDGVKNDLWKFFYASGELKSSGRYEEGKSAGDWEYFYKSGKLEATGSKAIEVKEGYWNMFYPDGKLKTEADYSDVNSTYKEYYQTGKLKIKGQFANKEHDGMWHYYYEDGSKEGSCHYNKGKGLFKGYYKNGALKTEGQLMNGEKIGSWKLFDEKGAIIGYYKTFEKEKYPSFEKKYEALDDTLFHKDNNTKKLAHKRVRKKKKRIRYPRIPKLQRDIILSSNPVSTIVGSLPISVEYYSPKRLSHQINFFYLQNPFFKSANAISLNEIYSNGFSIDYRLKMYQKEQAGGKPFFGHEARFKVQTNTIKISDSISDLISLSEREINYEYSALFGSRQFYKKISKKLTTEVFFGLGVGYKSISKNWGNNEEYDGLFGNTEQKSFNMRFRAGFGVGYVF